MRAIALAGAFASATFAYPAAASITLQDKVYFGTAWQILAKQKPGVPIPIGGGFVNPQVIPASDGSFYAGTVEKRDAAGNVTDVLLVFAGAQTNDLLPAEVMGYTGAPSPEAAQGALLYAGLIANPLYANAKIHVMGHSMGAGFTEYVAAWSINTFGRELTLARADFTGFGVPVWQGMILLNMGLPDTALDGVFEGYIAENDPTGGVGLPAIGPNGKYSGTKYVMPAYFGTPGLVGLAAVALDRVGAHMPTTFMAALGTPDWMSAADVQYTYTTVAADQTPVTYSPAYNFPNGAPLVVTGDTAADTISGLGGGDTITGAGGADVMTGGGGADRFVYTAVGDSTPTAPDRITDFSRSDGDRIDLSAIDARPDLWGKQALTFVPGTQFTGAGQVISWNDGTNTWVAVNTDTSPAPEMLIRLDGIVAVGAGDFIF